MAGRGKLSHMYIDIEKRCFVCFVELSSLGEKISAKGSLITQHLPFPHYKYTYEDREISSFVTYMGSDIH